VADKLGRLRCHGDPVTVGADDCDPGRLQERDPVDIVVFSDVFMACNKKFWKSDHLKCVLWICRRQPNQGFRIRNGWSIQTKRVLNSEVGGITNKSMWVGLATRNKRVLCWKPDERMVPNVLGQVVNSTVGGRPSMPIKQVHMGKVNTARGLLEWVTLPTVYFKEKWAK